MSIFPFIRPCVCFFYHAYLCAQMERVGVKVDDSCHQVENPEQEEDAGSKEALPPL